MASWEDALEELKKGAEPVIAAGSAALAAANTVAGKINKRTDTLLEKTGLMQPINVEPGGTMEAAKQVGSIGVQTGGGIAGQRIGQTLGSLLGGRFGAPGAGAAIGGALGGSIGSIGGEAANQATGLSPKNLSTLLMAGVPDLAMAGLGAGATTLKNYVSRLMGGRQVADPVAQQVAKQAMLQGPTSGQLLDPLKTNQTFIDLPQTVRNLDAGYQQSGQMLPSQQKQFKDTFDEFRDFVRDPRGNPYSREVGTAVVQANEMQNIAGQHFSGGKKEVPYAREIASTASKTRGGIIEDLTASGIPEAKAGYARYNKESAYEELLPILKQPRPWASVQQRLETDPAFAKAFSDTEGKKALDIIEKTAKALPKFSASGSSGIIGTTAAGALGGVFGMAGGSRADDEDSIIGKAAGSAIGAGLGVLMPTITKYLLERPRGQKFLESMLTGKQQWTYPKLQAAARFANALYAEERAYTESQ